MLWTPTAIDLSDDLADGEAVPVFNFMDSGEEDEFDRTVVESRPIEDVPRPPPDEEFFGPFSAGFDEDTPKSQEEGSRFSQRCSGSWKSSPVEESGVSPRK